MKATTKTLTDPILRTIKSDMYKNGIPMTQPKVTVIPETESE